MKYKISEEIKYLYEMFKKKIKTTIKCIIRSKKLLINEKTKKIYIILSADYGNLGDIAITYAQKKFLSNILPEYDIIEIPGSKFYDYYYSLSHQISNDDIITFIGGGNLGNLYGSFEDIRRRVINKFKDNLIISFPQTIVFTEDIYGKKSLEKSKKVYSKHSQLVLFAREEKSYDYMKKEFPQNEVYLVPDIVFSLKGKVKTNNYNGNKIGICFRNDVEKMSNTNIDEQIKNQLRDNIVENIDTYIGDSNVIYEKRYDQFFELLEQIRNVKVYITDRLHGMILAYITETPCIVFDNANHKIKGTYNIWLKDCNYIKLLEHGQAKDIKKYIHDLEKVQKNSIDLNKNFKQLEDVIKTHKKISL